MFKRTCMVLLCLVFALAVGRAQTSPPQTKAPLPDIAGEWTGTWSTYNPAQGAVPAKGLCKSLDCKVEYKDGVWHAAFEGDCGRPYKYIIKMEGRQAGKVVMFKGTVDLGPNDGGVFDWIGRANEKEFVGFFTSAYYTGVFSLSRK